MEGTGHLPTLHQLEQSNQVHAELWTASIGEYTFSVAPLLPSLFFSRHLYRWLQIHLLGVQVIIVLTTKKGKTLGKLGFLPNLQLHSLITYQYNVVLIKTKLQTNDILLEICNILFPFIVNECRL